MAFVKMTALNVLLWRNWVPPHDFPMTYRALEFHSMGGTDTQCLWHARALVDLGHRVQVLGLTHTDLSEEQVDFVGADDRGAQETCIRTGRIVPPDVILLEGGHAAAPVLRQYFPKARIVHVGQNIDRLGARAAFDNAPFVDVYAMVGPGQLAEYCYRFPRLRHRFMLLRNVVPWYRLYQYLQPVAVEERVIWVGNWGKKGLRQWAKVMQRILAEHPNLTWTLCGPRHSQAATDIPAYLWHGLHLPMDRIVIQDVPMHVLAQSISSTRIVLVSLGNECGPISVLDAHAMARPVLSGNDMVYKFSNPDGTGVRVTTLDESYKALDSLLHNPDLCEKLGRTGQQLILSSFTETNLTADMERLLAYLTVQCDLGSLAGFPAPSKRQEDYGEWRDRVERVWLKSVNAD